MPTSPSTLHLMCGKIASGKSTLASRLGETPGSVVSSEDVWIGGLYGQDISTVADYMQRMEQFRAVIAPHIVALLNQDMTVVLDLQANTVSSRRWMRSLLEQTHAAHVLHLLDVPDDVCIARLHERNAKGDHPFAATEDQYRQVSKHFEPPSPEEGFNVVRYQSAP